MFIIIQVPFVDTRLLETAENEFFFFPHHLLKKTDKNPYYRYIGYKNDRSYIDALPNSEQSYFGDQDLLKLKSIEDYNCKIVYNRLFADDMFFHFDIGIRVATKARFKRIDISNLINKLLKDDAFLAIKNLSKGKKKYSLGTLDQYIEELYVYATTHVKNFDAELLKNRHVCFGKPAVFFQYSERTCLLNVKRTTPIEVDGDVYMQKALLKLDLKSAHLWFLHKPESVYYRHNELDGRTRDLLRRLRICMLKLNSYREGLINIFQYFTANDFDFNNITKLTHLKIAQLKGLLEREKYYGIHGKQIMDIAIEKEMEIYYESWDEILRKITFCLSRMDSKIVYQNNASGILNATDLTKLLNEIEQIKKHLRSNGDCNDETDVLIGDLSKLKKTIEEKDESKFVNVIKEIGKQGLDISKRIGCSILASIITSNLIR